MTKNELNKRYFNWMCQLVCNGQVSKKISYSKLLHHLHNAEFKYYIDMDGNRACDGVDLRYRFAYENEYEDAMVATYLDDRPCSILEMMVALALRCEENIMDDPEIGNRIDQWFWGMIDNLGLSKETNSHYNANTVDYILDRFLNREYDRNGKGGLFVIHNPQNDMRGVEIWTQLCWYLDDFLHRE